LAQTPDAVYVNTDARQFAYVKARTFELGVPIFKVHLLSNDSSLYIILLFLKNKIFRWAGRGLRGLSLGGAELLSLGYYLRAIFLAKSAKSHARIVCIFYKASAPPEPS